MAKVRGKRTELEYRKALRVGLKDGLVAPGVADWGRSARVVLRAAINWSVERGERTAAEAGVLVASIPMEVRRPKKASRKLTPQDMTSLFAVLKEDQGTVALLVRFILGLGFRAEEALGMKRAQLERAVAHGEVTFKRKGDKEVGLLIGDRIETFKTLLALPDWKVVGDLISGGALESKKAVFRKLLKAWGQRHGLELHPHVLRHAFAQRMYEAGADIVEIQTWLGHESIETTRIYLTGRADPKKLFTL